MISRYDIESFVARTLGWPNWDAQKAQEIESVATANGGSLAPRAKIQVLGRELIAAGIPYEDWSDPRIPGLEHPILRILLKNRSAIVATPLLAEAFLVALNAGRTGVDLLIEGDTGSGKESVARVFHQATRASSKGPFVACNCTEIPIGIAEPELLGCAKNAGSSLAPRQGLVLSADGGTIFLDEIGDLPLDVQAKLLRVLQEREVRKVGETRCTRVDIRVVAATNRPLHREVECGRFRKDLYYRLRRASVRLPTLAECKIEILPIAYLVLDRVVERAGGTEKRSFTPFAVRKMIEYDWPGNVRELESVVESAVLFGSNPIPAQHLKISNAASTPSSPTAIGSGFTKEQLGAIEQMISRDLGGDAVLDELRRHHGFEKSRSTFFRYMRASGLVSRDVPDSLMRHRR